MIQDTMMHDKDLKIDSKTDKIKWLAISGTKYSAKDICI